MLNWQQQNNLYNKKSETPLPEYNKFSYLQAAVASFSELIIIKNIFKQLIIQSGTKFTFDKYFQLVYNQVLLYEINYNKIQKLALNTKFITQNRIFTILSRLFTSLMIMIIFMILIH